MPRRIETHEIRSQLRNSLACSVHLLRENLLCLCIPLQHFGVLTQLSTNLLLVKTDIGDAREEKI